MEFVSQQSYQHRPEEGLLNFETYHGFIESVSDAEKVIAAVKKGQLRQTFVRLGLQDQSRIRSGTVIVWEEGLSGIQRWTDGRTWSASRFHDEFLIYHELPPKPGSSKLRLRNNGLVKRAISIQDHEGKRYHLANYYYPESKLIRPCQDPRFNTTYTQKSNPISAIPRLILESHSRLSLPPLQHLFNSKSSYHAEDLRQLNLINHHHSL